LKFNYLKTGVLLQLQSSGATIRILPDICILISHNLSRLIKLGFLEGFEIVIPDFVEYTVDVLCDGRLKAGFYSELDELRELEKERMISLLYCDYEKPLPKYKQDLIRLEDEFILEIAVATNSILFTSDKELKDEATSIKQPVIYIPPMFHKEIKDLASQLERYG